MMDHHIEAATLDDFGGNEVKKKTTDKRLDIFVLSAEKLKTFFFLFFTIDYRSSWQ